MDKKYKTAWIVELIVALVTIACFISAPTFITSFCCGGCVTVFLLSTINLVTNRRKDKNIDNK